MRVKVSDLSLCVFEDVKKNYKFHDDVWKKCKTNNKERNMSPKMVQSITGPPGI